MSNEIRYNFKDYLENFLKKKYLKKKKEKECTVKIVHLEYHIAEPKFGSI
jgi:hypothetical protein